jgi:hypothetical protein
MKAMYTKESRLPTSKIEALSKFCESQQDE